MRARGGHCLPSHRQNLPSDRRLPPQLKAPRTARRRRRCTVRGARVNGRHRRRGETYYYYYHTLDCVLSERMTRIYSLARCRSRCAILVITYCLETYAIMYERRKNARRGGSNPRPRAPEPDVLTKRPPQPRPRRRLFNKDNNNTIWMNLAICRGRNNRCYC